MVVADSGAVTSACVFGECSSPEETYVYVCFRSEGWVRLSTVLSRVRLIVVLVKLLNIPLAIWTTRLPTNVMFRSVLLLRLPR